MKLIWLSDLHFEPSIVDAQEPDATARIQLIIDEVRQHHTDAAYCVISGDLVNDEPAHYLPLKRLLEQVTVPLLPLVGNHDLRQAMIDVFAPPIEPDSTFVQYAVETPEGVIICLDTHTPGEGKGSLCPKRYAWLKSVLDHSAAKPCYIFMHHPPAKLALGILDEICLEEHEAFIQFLQGYSNIKHIFCGHVHRPISASISGIPLSVLPSTRVQAPLPYPAWTWDEFVPANEAPMFGIVQIADGNVVVQYQQFDL